MHYTLLCYKNTLLRSTDSGETCTSCRYSVSISTMFISVQYYWISWDPRHTHRLVDSFSVIIVKSRDFFRLRQSWNSCDQYAPYSVWLLSRINLWNRVPNMGLPLTVSIHYFTDRYRWYAQLWFSICASNPFCIVFLFIEKDFSRGKLPYCFWAYILSYRLCTAQFKIRFHNFRLFLMFRLSPTKGIDITRINMILDGPTENMVGRTKAYRRMIGVFGAWANPSGTVRIWRKRAHLFPEK